MCFITKNYVLLFYWVWFQFNFVKISPCSRSLLRIWSCISLTVVCFSLVRPTCLRSAVLSREGSDWTGLRGGISVLLNLTWEQHLPTQRYGLTGSQYVFVLLLFLNLSASWDPLQLVSPTSAERFTTGVAPRIRWGSSLSFCSHPCLYKLTGEARRPGNIFDESPQRWYSGSLMSPAAWPVRRMVAAPDTGEGAWGSAAMSMSVRLYPGVWWGHLRGRDLSRGYFELVGKPFSTWTSRVAKWMLTALKSVLEPPWQKAFLGNKLLEQREQTLGMIFLSLDLTNSCLFLLL